MGIHITFDKVNSPGSQNHIVLRFRLDGGGLASLRIVVRYYEYGGTTFYAYPTGKSYKTLTFQIENYKSVMSIALDYTGTDLPINKPHLWVDQLYVVY